MYNFPFEHNRKFPPKHQLRDLERNADVSDDEVRSARPYLFALYQFATLDTRLSGHITTRQTAVTSYSWTVKNQQTGNKPIDDKDLTIINDSINTIIENHYYSPIFGAFCAKINWANEINNANRWVPDLTILQPFDFDKTYDKKQFIVFDDSDLLKPGMKYNDDSDLFLYDPGNNAQRGGVMRTVAETVLSIDEAYNRWLDYTDRLNGALVGQIKAEALIAAINSGLIKEEEKSKISDVIAEILADTGRRKYAVVEDIAEIKNFSLVDPTAGDSFNQFVEKLEKNIAVAILGQANTTELPNNGGSRAALQVLNLVKSDIHFADMNRTKKLIEKFLKMYWKRNYSKMGVCPFVFEWIYDANEDYIANATVLETLQRAGIDLDLSKEEIRSKVGFRKPEEGEETINFKSSAIGGVNGF